TCAMRMNGDVVCWGDNAAGQLGQPTTQALSTTPVKVPGVVNVNALSAGGQHTCALMALPGAVQCWGANESGQLGDGTNNPRPTPMPVMGLTDGTTIACGHAHTCARTQAGT